MEKRVDASLPFFLTKKVYTTELAMKKILLFLVIFLFALHTIPSVASAHLAGQAPYFKIDGVYSNLYPVAVTTLSDIVMPQDLAVDTYLVNAPIKFDIEKDQLPFPKEIVDTMQFSWDFGDGEKGSGLTNSHTYTKIGSYILVIYAEYTDATGKKYPTQLLQSVLFHVVPSKDYKLPQAMIAVNGEKITDPLTDTKSFTPNKPITFSGADSSGGDSEIITYEWDLSDGTTTKTKEITHAYNPDRNYVFPFLRVTTEDGFISDTYAELGNIVMINNSEAGEDTNTALPLTPLQIGGILVGINILIITTAVFLLKKKK